MHIYIPSFCNHAKKYTPLAVSNYRHLQTGAKSSGQLQRRCLYFRRYCSTVRFDPTKCCKALLSSRSWKCTGPLADNAGTNVTPKPYNLSSVLAAENPSTGDM